MRGDFWCGARGLLCGLVVDSEMVNDVFEVVVFAVVNEFVFDLVNFDVFVFNVVPSFTI
jgi:hypothetical protein